MPDRERALERYEFFSEPPLLALALLTIPLLVVEFAVADRLGRPDRRLIEIAAIGVWLVFVLDLAVRLLLARDRLELLRADWPSVLIVLSGVTLTGDATRGVAGFLRLLRPVVRLLAFGSEIAAQATGVLIRHTLAFVAFLALFTWWLSAALILAFEHGSEGSFDSLGDGLWWSAVTMATVGYGDLSPATAGGRVVALLTMFVGIGSFSLLTAKFAEVMTRVGAQRERGA